ncbi:MAG: alkaline phosphatase, partial [Planctomycetia bacterium]
MNRLADWQRGWSRFALVLVAGLALALIAWPGRKRSATAPATDRVREMQAAAERAGQAGWGHWGDRPSVYAAWSNHSNRLIPVYTFGLSLDGVAGAKSVYRDAEGLERLSGRLPAGTLNPQADYFDQTDIHRLQLAAAAAGKKHIILVVFDGLDWTTTRTAAIATTGSVGYDAGRGHGLFFQDYAGAPTDFGFCVTSPANDGTTFDVDAQAVLTPGGKTAGGYDATLGGA